MELSNRSLKKIESIKTAAKKLFNKYGYNLVTMDNVIQMSNVSRGTLYKYFSDKQELYETIIKDIYTEEKNSLIEIMSSSCSFIEKIEKIIEVRINKYTDTHQMFFKDHYIRSKSLDEYMHQYMIEMKDMRSNLYAIGREEGLISNNISDTTLALYFDIIQTGLSEKYHDLSLMPKQDLKEILHLIYFGTVSGK